MKKILTIKLLGHESFDGSCGTGYTQYYNYWVTQENGLPAKVSISHWYESEEGISHCFSQAMREFFGEPSEYNFDEALRLYKEELKKIK